MSTLITLGVGEVLGCLFWAYCGTKIMVWVKGEFAVVNDLRMKATALEASIKAKV